MTTKKTKRTKRVSRPKTVFVVYDESPLGRYFSVYKTKKAAQHHIDCAVQSNEVDGVSVEEFNSSTPGHVIGYWFGPGSEESIEMIEAEIK